MKKEALQSLLIAQNLFDQARVLVHSDNKYSSSAALVILQDALELIVKASLLELSVDDDKNIHSIEFDQLLAVLRKQGVPVKKSGTLKAMNKERVIVKHYGQVAEPETVKTYMDATELAADAMLLHVFKASMREINLSLLIDDPHTRGFLRSAEVSIAARDPIPALIAIRKALFVSILADYEISRFATMENILPWDRAMGRGSRAAHYKQDKKWIEENVKTPFDYIQIDYDKIKIDLIEWGVSTQDFWNIWRLTPDAFCHESDENWQIASKIYSSTEDSLSIARYCLDRMVNLLLKKQQYNASSRWLGDAHGPAGELMIKSECWCLEKTDQTSKRVTQLTAGQKFSFFRILDGLDGHRYAQLAYEVGDSPAWDARFYTFVDLECCTITQPTIQ